MVQVDRVEQEGVVDIAQTLQYGIFQHETFLLDRMKKSQESDIHSPYRRPCLSTTEGGRELTAGCLWPVPENEQY